MNEEQLICINIDDSGKLVNSEKVTIYAGTVFLSKKEKDKFITNYRSIIKNTKCHYCKNDSTTCVQKNCPELKHNMLKPQHIRQLINYIKKYNTFACIIENDKIYPQIKRNTASRGRYLDFALKLTIKQLIKHLIEDKEIDPYKPVTLVINIDEQTTKSNGYYNLENGINEELLHGIYNFNYNVLHKPILFNTLQIHLHYQKSDKSYLIQAADLVAGSIRRHFLKSKHRSEFLKNIGFIKYYVILP